MGEGDRERWNAAHAAGQHAAQGPDPFVVEALASIERGAAPGSALDLACGAGRHALELARRGWTTCAWDVSEVALARCAAAARAAGVALTTRQIDLSPAATFRPDARFDLVVVVDFLDRELFPALAELVRPGGWLIYATFAPGWTGEKPGARFRISTAELSAGLRGFAPLAESSAGGRSGLLALRRDAPE